MNRRNKIIIILVIVIIVGIVAVIANSFLSTPTLTLGDKNINESKKIRKSGFSI